MIDHEVVLGLDGEECVQYLNLFFSVLTLSKVAYGEEYRTPAGVTITWRDQSSFKQAHRPIKVQVEAWLASPSRRTFHKMEFIPSQIGHVTQGKEKTFNTFSGLAHTGFEFLGDVDAAVRPLVDHIKHILCKDVPAHYEYLLSWLAHGFQKPEEKTKVALVLDGDEGAGKGILLQKQAEAIGLSYFVHVQDLQNTLFGTFSPENAERCLLCFVDEAKCTSPKEAQKVLTMISEPTHHVEHKHGLRVALKSYTNYAFASNDKSIVIVSAKSRRYFCLDASSERAGKNPANAAYFAAIAAVPPAAWAAFLRSRDLSQFDPRFFPDTDRFTEQKKASLPSSLKFWDSCLRQEQLPQTVRGENWTAEVDWADENKLWPKLITARALFACFRDYCIQQNDRTVLSVDQFMGQLKCMDIRWPLTGRHRRTVGDSKPSFFAIPSVEDAKRIFVGHVQNPSWFEDE